MKTTRRGFMKAAAFGAGAAALAPLTAHAAETESFFGPDEIGMLYDSTVCVGCKACVYACRKANFDLDDSSYLSKEDAKDTRWVDAYELDYRINTIIKMYQNPDEPSDYAFIKRGCNHCRHAGCVSACPVKAMTKNPETGVVEYDKHRCVGCRYCQLACPFNVPTFEWHQPIPKIVKCEMCRKSNLITKGITACCEVCPAKAVIFGKRSYLMEVAKSRLAENPDRYIDKIYGERDYGGTNVIYLSRVDFEKLGLPNLPEYSYARTSENIQHTLYKGMIAPAVLYTVLAVAAYRNIKKHHGDDDKGGH